MKPNEHTITTGATLKLDRTALLPGRPIFTIATILTTISFVLLALVTGVTTTLGLLPADVSPAVVASITQWSIIGGAIAVGLGATAKALYAKAVAERDKYQQIALPMLSEPDELPAAASDRIAFGDPVPPPRE